MNREQIWKIQTNSKLNSEKIRKIQKKSKLNSENVGNKVWENEMFYSVMYQKKQLTDISNVAFEKVREKSTAK